MSARLYPSSSSSCPYPTYGTRCPTCTCTHRVVPASGPRSASIMSIGERPGGQEEKEGIPFIGVSGQEYNENYLRLAGLERPDIYVTNTVKCGEDGNRKPTPKEIASCANHHLRYEIEMVDPQVILLLGATACSLVPGLSLDIEHGIPRPAKIFSWEGTVVPMYHPAAGMHDTGTMIPLLEDFTRLGDWLNGSYHHPEPLPEHKLLYISESHPARITNFLESSLSFMPDYLASDTESHAGVPFSIQFSCAPGKAVMIPLWKDKLTGSRAGDGVLKWMLQYPCPVVFHNLPADVDLFESFLRPFTERYRTKFFPLAYRDTMQEAYHLGNLPQGLKALGYRLLGERMRTWEDVVKPHSRNAVLEWLVEAESIAKRDLQRVERKQLKTKVKETVKPGQTERALSRIIRYTVQNEDYDPWEKLAEYWDVRNAKGADDHYTREFDCDYIYTQIGMPPLLGIGNVPHDEAVRYACQDADVTGRVAKVLADLRQNATVVPHVHSEDMDR